MPLENKSPVTIPATENNDTTQTVMPPYLFPIVEETRVFPSQANNLKIFVNEVPGHENFTDSVSISLTIKDFTINLDNEALPI